MSAAERPDCHCACGALLGRLTPQGVEIKCRRCKRIVLVRLETPKPAR